MDDLVYQHKAKRVGSILRTEVSVRNQGVVLTTECEPFG